MEANFFISKETGLVARSVQKMKTERPEEYELTLIGTMAKKIGLDLDELETLYESGIDFNGLQSLVKVANGFKESLKAAGFKESSTVTREKINVRESYLREELSAYRANNKRINVSIEAIEDETTKLEQQSNYFIHVYTYGETCIEFDFHDRTSNINLPISELAQDFIYQMKVEGYEISRVSTSHKKHEMHRHWKVKDGAFYSIDEGQYIDGKFYGRVDFYDKELVYSRYIIAGVEYDCYSREADTHRLRIINALVTDDKERERIEGHICKLDDFFSKHADAINNEYDLVKTKEGIYVDISGSASDIENMIFASFGFDYNILLSIDLFSSSRQLFRINLRKKNTIFVPTKKSLENINDNGCGSDIVVIDARDY